MTELDRTDSTDHYVQIDESLCKGCVLCMKVCPARAIRVIDQKAVHMEGLCIDCGECIRVCPNGAVKAITTGRTDIDWSKAIVSVSPVLYTQFSRRVTSAEVAAALRKMGFLDVDERRDTLEMFNIAMGLYIAENRKRGDAPRPLISAVCPVVVRLIAHRFPSLLKHIPPLLPPRELAAREAKKQAAQDYGVKEGEIKAYHITPCSAKMMSIRKPLLVDRSYLDGAIGINEIYKPLKRQLQKTASDREQDHPVGVGIAWVKAGGEIAGMDVEGKLLAVSGIQETIRYLEKIEMGLLDDIDYVEFRTCPEGCIGGPLTVVDKYQAKHLIQHSIRKYGVARSAKFEEVKALYDEGWFFCDMEPETSESRRGGLSLSEAIERQEKVEAIYRRLPGKECGACGSPDCKTFAEDVADGRMPLENCLMLGRASKRGRKR